MKRVCVVLAISLLGVSGCIRPSVTPKLDALLRSLKEPIERIDPEIVKGKSIVIDPGHGGRFTGAIGQNNITEKDINLGVALYLYGLLKEAGAEVVMTRYKDTELVSRENGTLREDLQVRCDIAEIHNADLFLSIHHNADIVPQSDKNQIETYYKMSDPGPSFDAAGFIHRHLVKNLGIHQNKIIPGNFYVLRHNRAPAVLCEPCYISNIEVSEKLKLSSKQRLEAEALFLGLLDYFSQGVPRILDVSPPDGSELSEPTPLFSAIIQDDENGAGIDPMSIRVRLDGKIVPHSFDINTGRITYIPNSPLEPGQHTLSIDGRNVKGNASKTATSKFFIRYPVARITLTVNPPLLPPNGECRTSLKAEVYDRFGNLIKEGTWVRFESSAGKVEPSNCPVVGGEALSYLRSDVPEEILVRARCEDLVAYAYVSAKATDNPYISLTVKDEKTRLPLPDARVILGGIGQTNRDGFFAKNLLSGIYTMRIECQGFIPFEALMNLKRGEAVDRVIFITPVAKGLLRTKTFCINPEFGGAEYGPVGPTCVRSQDINLRVARYLRGYLEMAGARTYLTRDEDVTVKLPDRVKLAEMVDADYFISIGHGGSQDEDTNFVKTLHYPTSIEGLSLAQAIHESLTEMIDVEDQGIEGSSRYCLVHTSMPAVHVNLSHVTNPKEEIRLGDPSYNQKRAYAIYLGILCYLGLKKEDTSSLTGLIQDEGGTPISNVLVVLDGYLPMQTDNNGRFDFRLLRPGIHKVAIHSRQERILHDLVFLHPGEVTEKNFVVRQKL